ncbi:VPS52 [Candida pseudojiufengensis]|uniref:VPS52 n=1 Tax=Candida pseudojiufengensis TaxID=497109 RepID=UPI0022245478|nr:VPS52 [Candida pseudojiufengensis]KAI5961816.1 VPS52 [Candida pseudojiufengensis]
MGIAVLDNLLPIDEIEKSDSNEYVFEPDLMLEHCRSIFEQTNEIQLAETMSQFHSYNKAIQQFKQKLDPVGVILEDFSKDLKNLSSSLVSLEQQSSDLSKDSNVNKMITRELEKTINEKVLPPEMIKDILHEELSNEYLEKVNFILEKMNDKDSASIKAKVVERIRDFVIDQIRLLRSPRSVSSQKVQQKLKDSSNLFHFLQSQQPNLGMQLQQAYFLTMKWYYKSRFAKYIYSLEKLSRRHIEISVFDSPNYINTFENRSKILYEEESCMPSQLAETITNQYTIEFVFLQLLEAIIDNVSVEYFFVIDYFYKGNEKDNSWADKMFEEVYKMSKEFLTFITTGSTDIYAVLLIIKLIYKFQNRIHEYHIPVLDDYLNSLLLMLWPIFTKIVDLNCDSMKRHISKSPKSTAPLITTQQFGLFYSYLVKLSIDGTPLETCITRIRNDFESSLTKASSSIKGADREIFLNRNYSLVETILTNESENNEAQINHFKLLAKAYT